jgi:carbon monoxide dehydrogenase subunit G
VSVRLTDEFTVGAPLGKTWEALLDVRRVAACMPGASIEPGREGDVCRGTMRVALGAVDVAYAGVARLAEVDVDERYCAVDVKAVEQGGSGTAAATVRSRLSQVAGGTKVEVEAELAVTGRRFERGVMEDVSSKMLAEFAARLEREALSEPAAAAAVAPEPAPVSSRRAAPKRVAVGVGVGAAAVAVAGVALGSRRRKA